MGNQAFDAKRTQIWWFDPEVLVIVGLDTDDGPEHELYDERILKPVGEEFVRNVRMMGIITPISIRKDGDRAEVVAGRRRVRAARKANEQLKDEGGKPILVPCKLGSGDASKFIGIIISENEQREADTPLARARKAAKLMDQGGTEGDAAVLFGVTTQTIGDWLALLDLDKSVQKMVERGALSPTAASKLASLSRVEQKVEAAKLMGNGKPTVAAAIRAVKASKSGGKAIVVAPSKRVLRKLLKANGAIEAEGQLSPDFVNGILFALGELSSDSVEGLASLLDES